LSEHVGETVRVGGRIVSVSGTVVTVEDGTGQAAVRLNGSAASLAGQLRTGDLVNITGTVARTASGGLEIGVTDAAGLARIPAPASLAAASDALAASSAAAAGPPLGGDDTTPVASSGSSAPLLAVALLLGVLGAALIGVVAAGPKRRARLTRVVQQSVAGARARLQRFSQRAKIGWPITFADGLEHLDRRDAVELAGNVAIVPYVELDMRL